MTLAERSEGLILARALSDIARALPLGWSVSVGQAGQIRMLPPKEDPKLMYDQEEHGEDL